MTARLALAALAAVLAAIPCLRARARGRRAYVRMIVEPYRTDRCHGDALAAALDTLHRLLLRRWWRRLIDGQPSFALELRVTTGADGAPRGELALSIPAGCERVAEAALRGAYPNLVLRPAGPRPLPRALLRLRKRRPFIERIAVVDPEHAEPPRVDRLLTVMAAAGGDATLLQVALTPAPASLERFARRLHERRERGRVRSRDGVRETERPSQVAQVELLGGLELQHRPLFFGDIRVGAGERGACAVIASELRAGRGENRLVQRGVSGRCRRFARRLDRGEGAPLPDPLRGVYAASELAALWQLPSIGFASVPIARRAVPVAPAPPAILRPAAGQGLLRDAIGPVTIHPELRRQNTAVVGAVEQGKSSLIVASVAEDLRRPQCAVILLDPKGDAADAALAAVPADRTCTLLDLADPTCGFNPLAVVAPPDAVADGVVAALRQLFAEGDIRASSDRYLRNAIIAALAHEREATLWDVARLLGVGEEGRVYRERVAASLLGRPEYAEVASFFAAELPEQLTGARATTTAKLDAPANKLARLLNSASLKRVLLNDSLRLDLDGVIERGEVLIVKGALGEAGTSNVAVLMQLIAGSLDAALARQQDRREAAARTAVALKIDEAPLVINAAFAQTLALKRSAGLETVAAWQTDSQWEPDLREQLDALFAHRVYFATASAQDARAAAAAMLDQYSDQLRAGPDAIAQLADPDVRLHLPRHHAIASWTTPEGRQRPFVAATIPFAADPGRLAALARAQAARGARPLTSFARPHWDDAPKPAGSAPICSPPAAPAAPAGDEPPALAELAALDRAVSARIVPAAAASRPRAGLDPADLERLAWLAAAGWVLTTQLHRRFDPGKALTATQRRLKRLADARLIERLQLHAGDGGGVPMCCAISALGRELLDDPALPAAPMPPRPAGDRGGLDVDALARVRTRIHVVAWLLALETALGAALTSVRGPRRFRLTPPTIAGRPAEVGDLRLASGRTPRGFGDELAPVAPLAAAEIALAGGRRSELLIDVVEDADLVAVLERYDRMIAGWWALRHEREPPTVVLLFRDAAVAARACALADGALTAAHAYAGQDPAAWPRPGRERIVFAAEPDLHQAGTRALRVPTLPPPLRDGAIATAPVAVDLAPEAPACAAGARARWH